MLIDALPKLPINPFEAICHCLENEKVSMQLAAALLGITHSQLQREHPSASTVAAAVRGVSRSRSVAAAAATDLRCAGIADGGKRRGARRHQRPGLGVIGGGFAGRSVPGDDWRATARDRLSSTSAWRICFLSPVCANRCSRHCGLRTVPRYCLRRSADFFQALGSAGK